MVERKLLKLGLERLKVASVLERDVAMLVDLFLERLDALQVRRFEFFLDLEPQLLEVFGRRVLLLERLERLGLGLKLLLPRRN